MIPVIQSTQPTKTQMLYGQWTKHHKKYGNYKKLQHSPNLMYYRDEEVTHFMI